MQYTALIVDDETDLCHLIATTLKKMDISSCSAHTLADAKEKLSNGRFDFCLTDLRLPDGSGLDLIPIVVSHNIPVAMISAHGQMDSAIEALKRGAFDFLSKPLELQQLRDLAHSALKRAPKMASSMLDNLIGETPRMQQLKSMIQKVAKSQAAISITGPSGSGKECVARAIHACSPRAEAPFVPVNCGAIPEALIESELFGHKKGSFTHAIQDKDGLFQAAHQGTLFLDEVADLPLETQVTLLRAIQERKIRPIGSEKEISVDVRILCATHQDLAALIQAKKFREDLYYRLNVIEVRVPGLEERREDIPLLAEHILAKLSKTHGQHPHITQEACQTLQSHFFPGHVRELENILERALILSEGNITADALQLSENKKRENKSADANDALPLDEQLLSLEKKRIQEALNVCGGDKKLCAEELGISLRSLRYRLKKLGLGE